MNENISASHEQKRASPRLISPLFLRYVSPITSCPDSVNNRADVCLKDCGKGRETCPCPFFFFFFCVPSNSDKLWLRTVGLWLYFVFKHPFPKGLVKERGLLDLKSTAGANCTTLPFLPLLSGFCHGVVREKG